MNAHIGENAELYALGVLDERTRALVDAHASNCEACAARLGEAERTIALIEEDAEMPASLDRRMRPRSRARAACVFRPVWLRRLSFLARCPHCGFGTVRAKRKHSMTTMRGAAGDGEQPLRARAIYTARFGGAERKTDLRAHGRGSSWWPGRIAY